MVSGCELAIFASFFSSFSLQQSVISCCSGAALARLHLASRRDSSLHPPHLERLGLWPRATSSNGDDSDERDLVVADLGSLAFSSSHTASLQDTLHGLAATSSNTHTHAKFPTFAYLVAHHLRYLLVAQCTSIFFHGDLVDQDISSDLHSTLPGALVAHPRHCLDTWYVNIFHGDTC
jgi:hypothetical protein